MRFRHSVEWFRLNDLRVVCLGLIVAGFATAQNVSPQVISQRALQQIAELTAEKEARSPAQRKLDSRLHYAGLTARGRRITNAMTALPSNFNALDRDSLGRVLVDIHAKVTPTVLDALRNAGAVIISALPEYQSIRARVPLLNLESLAGLGDIEAIRPADRGVHGSLPMKGSSSRTQLLGAKLASALHTRKSFMRGLDLGLFIRPVSQGDIAHGANQVRSAYGFNGSGVKVGVLSDGVDSLAALQASGDLPAVNIIPGQGGSGNEGSAMLEIVYDLAPGAQLYFATAHSGTAQMAANIIALQQAGCDIILDDWTYFAEGVFQDGNIAVAVNSVTARGVLYFSDAQNSGNLDSSQSGTWEGDFADSGTVLPGIPAGYAIHSFNGTNHNLITANSTEGFLSIKWSDPLGASANDYDFYLLNTALTAVIAASTNIQNGAQDPIEAVTCASPCGLNNQIVIVKHPEASVRALHVDTERGRLQLNTDGATFGHNAGLNTITVAAVNVARAGGGLFVGGAANPVETYSSDGSRRIFYNPNGFPITPDNFLFSTNGGTLLQKDDIAAADCASGHAPGFTTFCGTSAATPHAGAIAALLKSGFPGLTAPQILAAMKATALDIMAPGTDRDSGGGIVMANRAAAALMASPALQARVLTTSPIGTDQLSIDLQITNSGSGMAFSVSLDTLDFRTLRGSGEASSIWNLPIQIGTMGPGQSLTLTLVLQVPASVTRFSMSGGMSAKNGSGIILSASANNAIAH